MTWIGLAGCAHIHTPGFVRALLKRKDVAVKSCWDHDGVRAAKTAGQLSAKVVEDPKAIWADAEVRGVIVCSETDRHEKLVLPAAAAGKDLFVEKPLGFAADDARKMADAIEKAGVRFQTGYFMRGHRVYRFVRDHVARGSFGTITRARMSNCHSGALGGWFDGEWRWMANPSIAGCGAFGDLGTHVLDVLIWMLGPIKQVCTELDNGTGRYPNCEETGETLIRFANGAIGTMAAAWDDLADPVTLQVSGTEGYAAVINGQLYFHSKQVAGSDASKPVGDAALGADLPHSFDQFLTVVAGGTGELVTAREAAYRSIVMGAMYESAKARKWVGVPER